VVAYLSELGRVEGAVVRRGNACFAIELAATPGKIEKLAAKMASLTCNAAE
jgi:hypothetical protein